MEYTVTCNDCRQTSVIATLIEHCPHCQKPWTIHLTKKLATSEALDQCPFCASPHLYRQRDFNRTLGIGLIILGVALAYYTYGLSLVIVTLIDYYLYKIVGEVGCCYKCHAQFRHSPLVDKLPTFQLQLHDYYRSVRA